MNKQKLTLLIVLIILVLAVSWSVISTPRLKTTTDHTPVTSQRKKVEKSPAASAVKPAGTEVTTTAQPQTVTDERVVRLDLLDQERSGFKGYRRNIFKPLFRDEIKFMKQKSAAFKPLPVPPVAAVVPKPIPPVVPPVPETETHKSTLARFTFLGFLKKDNRKTIFLANDKDIVLVRKGELFAKRYEATEITDQALTIRVSDTGEEIIVPLTENKPLAAASKK